MCGRAAFRVDRSYVQRHFVRIRGRTAQEDDASCHVPDADEPLGRLTMRMNGAPGNTTAYVIANRDGEIELREMVFGLIPSTYRVRTDADGGWPRVSDFYRLFNARSEEIAPTYRKLVHRGRRCVVFVRGFYEWRSESMGKQPYFIHRRNTDNDGTGTEESMLMLAGLWDEWTGGDDGDGAVMMRISRAMKTLRSFTIFTRDADASWIHPRIPVILRDDVEAEAFLRYGRQPNTNGRDILTYYSVDAGKINTPHYEGDDCIERTRRAALKDTTSIASFFSSRDTARVDLPRRRPRDEEAPKMSNTVFVREEEKDDGLFGKKTTGLEGLDTDGAIRKMEQKNASDDRGVLAGRSRRLTPDKKRKRIIGIGNGSSSATSPSSAASSPSSRRTHQAGIKEFFAPSPAPQSK